MSLTELLLIRRLNIGVLSFSFLIVLFLGGGILWGALATPPPLHSSDLGLEANGRSMEMNERVPASIAPTSVIIPDVPPALSLSKQSNSIETVELSCVKNAHEYSVQTLAKQVRIRGRWCMGDALNITETTITNRSSGVDATLFSLENNRFTSDYLSLVEGANDIWVQLKGHNGGAFLTQVTVLRISE